MSAREEVLQRIRRATQDVTETDPMVDVPVDWVYGRPLGTKDVIADFVEKVEDYKAAVRRCAPDGAAAMIVEALEALDTKSIVVPAGFPEAWIAALRHAGFALHRDDPQLTHAELNAIDAVVTTAAVGMADSGTIALDHGEGQGRRALTLLPDRHICVVHEYQVVSDVPEGIARLAPAIRERRPVTWLSGGSATSDIELSRVEGVHGPRHLSVVLVAD
ncbi:LUD domain-containing protein [Tessaracoccus sp. ZS01]|uniref:LutC/YkgG family protein n=1 Tax=Tessaracoccus sp. ZS01 TaxID=1906324 RepID=UPI00096E7C4B|nr:LUD domain-containing protein [Tessaracoccus sp. ZS01]MCG6566434.1 lactate utilization protein C [Tessaracoccus sp. ZS01]OMG58886.1 lactate utilization protein C [Tessaracoccus sp. ZS01]